MIEFFAGKKTYLFLIVYAALGIAGFVQDNGASIPSVGELQEVILASALAALRAGVAKVTG